MVGQWDKELRENNLLRLVIETMESSHPARFAINGDNDGDISATRAAIELGTTRGYSLYGDRLKLLATRVPVSQPLPDPEYKPEPKDGTSTTTNPP